MDGHYYSQPVKAFRGKVVPGAGSIAGYAWIMERYALALPTLLRATAIAGRHRPRTEDRWVLLPERYAPDDELGSQLEFALKWEGIDLAVLDALSGVVSGEEIAAIVRRTPTGKQTRRLWFLYEWLTDRRLDIPDAQKTTAVDAVDPRRQFALSAGVLSKRHRVRDNMPGTRAFCPMVRRTPALTALAASGLGERVNDVIATVRRDVIERAAALLLLSDSRATFRIEGETPSPDRARRWAQSLESAGTTELTVSALEELQRIVIGDARFVGLGLRTEGGFIGEHDRVTQSPIPDHISARAQDLHALMQGLLAYDRRAGRGALDPVVASAVEAFGFVYIHPFEDGNGRIHRWLLHHVLAAGGFARPGVVFPVSSVILRRLDEYKRVLESYSRPLLASIEWRPTSQGNVEVLNDTASWYRYFDATLHAEFTYECVKATIEEDLPYEVAYLEAYDEFVEGVSAIVEMPARTLGLLHRFLRQNAGRLSQRAREREFEALTDDEAARIEALYAGCVAGLPHEPSVTDETDARVTGGSSPI